MKIAIFEISKSHEECIYSQIQFLNAPDYSVDLIINVALKHQIKDYKFLVNSVEYIKPVKKGAFKKLRQQFQVASTLKKYDFVIFNTASSSKFVRNLNLMLLLSQIKTVGILHNGKKLHSSFTQKIISLKTKRYFFLSDNILDKIPKKMRIRLSSFYPIYFPEFNNNILKSKNEIWVAIPGRIDWARRDYMVLIKALIKIKSLHNIKFLLLGKLNKNTEEGNRLWKLIKVHQLESYFMVFDDFIENQNYHSILKLCEFVMPLLINDENYLRYKISGSFNLAYAYKKTIVCKSYFKVLPDLEENGIFYQENYLSDLIEEIDKRKIIGFDNYMNPKWKFEYQKSKYLKLLN